ncbi:alpha/beta hydrolase [Flavobacterium cerinum]|uniref:Alpha/beta hydrolase n=1 Tax=Flavobacterium cerinum TaxID=2502784 RepID=A0ABY5IQW3_9FLAO|nr:alpha/beta hydrolase [Flavobacterium cerinum]UUC45237.1 alpha/beta hydrolase [Flavobacterium cerinum]
MKIKKILFRSFLIFLISGILLYSASKISPWPSALLIRFAFDYGADKKAEALEKHLPENVSTISDRPYDPTDKAVTLDIYYPEKRLSTATIVWIHGGGWLSGNKNQVAGYCKILASKGFTVANIDYTLAPSVHYPNPVRQLNRALDYLIQNRKKLHIHPEKIILAGDSAGAQIAAQMAVILTSPEYARLIGIRPKINSLRLAGLLLYCGPYDISKTNVETGFKGLAKPLLWSYSGTKDFMTDRYFKTASITPYLTKDFPPAFITAGNGDDLLIQSEVLARDLTRIGVPVTTLFFPKDYTPKLPHEYQFNLDTEAGQSALERSVQFLKNL